MRPPPGFEEQLYPLRHEVDYSFGLSATSAAQNSTICTLVKNYKTVLDATTHDVNPKHASFVTDKGAVCQPMSIIDKLRLVIKINLTHDGFVTNQIQTIKCMWMPIFFSFPEKLDATDEKSTDTVAEILDLTKDATEEDVTPTWSTTKLDVSGVTELAHPVSTVNLAEVFGLMNLTTDTTMESTPFNNQTFHRALKYYTNKGALKACIGQTRHVTLDRNHMNKTFFIDKFVPRAVRRIMPYSFFGILFHVPRDPDIEQFYNSKTIGAGLSDIGFKVMARYHEWHPDFNQKMVDQS